jgi:hypothetical protein
MKPSIVAGAILCGLFTCSMPAPAQEIPPASKTLSQHDRDYLMSQMHATRKLFLDSVADLTPEQWNFKAGPDRWSIAECAEHIAVSEDFIFNIPQTMLKSEATPERRKDVKATDEKITEMTVDRTVKFKAPEPMVPKKRWATPAEAVSHFKDGRDKHIAYVETTQDDLRDHFMQHPAAGWLDGYQWLLLLSAHTERRTMQILEVKADPKYPK